MTIEALIKAREAIEAIREADTAGATPKQVVAARALYEPTLAAIDAALAGAPAAPGRQLVPVEPTPRMLTAGGDRLNEDDIKLKCGLTWADALKVYRAMLEAAPNTQPCWSGRRKLKGE